MRTLTDFGVLEMVVRVHGRNVKEHEDKEKGKHIEGRPGTEYELEIRNSTNRRVLSVLTVDGLSVLCGGKANPTGRGYVLNPYSSQIIPCWYGKYEKRFNFTFGVLPADPFQGDRQDQVGIIEVTYFFEISPGKTPEELSRTMKLMESGEPHLANMNMIVKFHEVSASSATHPLKKVLLTYEPESAATLRIQYADAATLWNKYQIQVMESHETPDPIIDQGTEEMRDEQ